jgi:hypothetical protein
MEQAVGEEGGPGAFWRVGARMSWKLGVLWGILLTIIEWLGYLAARGGLPQSTVWVSLLTLVVFGYIGYSAFKVSGSWVQSILTAMLAGIITGILGSLTFFLEPKQSALSSIVLIVETGFATAVFALALGAVGVTVSRIVQRFRHST